MVLWLSFGSGEMTPQPESPDAKSQNEGRKRWSACRYVGYMADSIAKVIS